MIDRFLDSKKFIPDYHVNTIYDLDFAAIKKSGIRLLLIDVDNTLIPYDKFSADEALIELMERLKTLGFFIVFVSNNRFHRIRFFAKPLNISFVSNAKKPLKRGFKKAMRFYEKPVAKTEVLVIGDQLMTDVYGAKRTGLKVALVTPIKLKTERWYTRINRKVEQKMLQKIKLNHASKYETLNLKKRVRP